MVDFILDFGNAQGKWYMPYSNREGVFMHAIAPLTENQWQQAVGRGKSADGLIRVNGSPFAVGKAAWRYQIKDRPRGAARYHRDYYGVALAYALSSALTNKSVNIDLVASYPPGDIDYVPHLIQAASDVVEVDGRNGYQAFKITRVSTFDEPLGGYSHYAFTKDGTPSKKNAYLDSTVLVVDVGGYTVDVAAIDPGGEIDPMSLDSTRTGVLNLMNDFESELRANNRDLFQNAGDLDPRRIENAIRTGVYHFGNKPLECGNEAQAAIYALVNDVIQVINGAGGVANFDAILMTGGGAALIVEHLVSALPYIDFVMADPNKDRMMYANVYGGAKIMALLRRVKA